MSKLIGILGCGWLGTPLAKSLIQDGHAIKGTTTSKFKLQELQQQGIAAHLISITEKEIYGDITIFLKGIDILIINIPPKLRKSSTESYVKKMQLLSAHILKLGVKKLLFISSTSVYGDVEGEVTEDTIPNPITVSGKQLLKTENLFLNTEQSQATIIRFGGLIGNDRHPVFHLSGKKGLKNGGELINLIHLDDCIHMIKTILNNGYWNEIFNGVYPFHPTKETYYISEAIKRGMPPPEYEQNSKKISKKSITIKNFYVKKHVLSTSISS